MFDMLQLVVVMRKVHVKLLLMLSDITSTS
jgi:hypothetical protein